MIQIKIWIVYRSIRFCRELFYFETTLHYETEQETEERGHTLWSRGQTPVFHCDQVPRGYESRGPPSFTVDRTLFQGGDVANHCQISRKEPCAGAGGGRKETYHLPSQNSRVTRPNQLFLRPYGDSCWADHYAHYLSVPLRRAADAGGPNYSRKPNSC